MLELRVVPASQSFHLGTITIQGNDSKDIVDFRQMIENAALGNPFFAQELQRMAFDPATRKPILIKMSREAHTTFGDNYGTNEVWVKDLKYLPAAENPGAYGVTQGWAVLHILEERWDEADTGIKNRNQDHAYAIDKGNIYRAYFFQPQINTENSSETKYEFADGTTETITRVFGGAWKTHIKSPKNPPTMPSSGQLNIFWILSPDLSDCCYAGVPFSTQVVAEFSASNKSGPISDPSGLVADILWGDGSTSVGEVQHYEEGGYVYPTEFVVLGSHAYAASDDYQIQVQIVGATWYSENNAVVNEADVSDWTSISWAQSPQVPNSYAGVGFIDAVIGYFFASWDGQPDSNPDDFQPVIAWGDGSTSTGEIEPADGPGDPSNEYAILASHTYQQAGTWPIQVQMSDATSYTQNNTIDGSADVLS